MRKVILVICMATWISISSLSAQVTTISRNWKFKTGDDLAWADSKYDDGSWQDLKTGLWWKHAGITNEGFAWYRKRIYISSQLKPAVEKLGFLKLSLGQIQDADQAFFNGKQIGQTGSFQPYAGDWQKQRIYFVQPEDILWDKENVVAVRVFCNGDNGGMHTGPYTFEPYKKSIADFVSIRSANHVTKESREASHQYSLIFNNQGQNDYDGILMFALTDESGKRLSVSEKKITIKKESENTFDFPYKPGLEGIYTIKAIFTETTSGNRLSKELIISTLTKVDIPVAASPDVVVPDKVQDVFVSAPFGSQKIEGVLGERLRINLTQRLMQIDEQGILDGYLDRPGYQNWIGEHVGKYLETASNTWRYTRNQALKAQMDRIVYVLIHTQLENGYLGTYTPDKYWTSWDVWSHKYNMAGLLAYYRATGYSPALQTARRIGDLLCRTFGNTPGQLNIITSGTHVGMASASVLDPIVDLYKLTGDKKYLEFARYIVHAYDDPDGPKIIQSLLAYKQVNKVANGKAYEMLSNLVGIIKLYKVTGEEDLLKAVNIAWNDIVTNRLYVTGTSSSYELFLDDHQLPAGETAHMGEGCVTTTWLQFNYQLFTLTGELKYFHQLEKTVYNHLLGAENPQNGCVSYYTSLQDQKPYSCGITCCLSSVPRGIAMIPLFNYGKKSGIPTLLLFESSHIKDTILTKDNTPVALSIQAASEFPGNGKITYIISPSLQAKFPVSVRVPEWVSDCIIQVHGKKYTGKAGQYLTFEKEWKTGDTIGINFNMPLQMISGGKSYPDRVALQRGPQILSLDYSLNSSLPFTKTGFVPTQTITLQSASLKLPAIWIGKQAYSLPATTPDGQTKELILVPFADASQTGEKAEVWLPLQTGTLKNK